ncbi:MAG: hypothetical protein NNA22_10530, partial [Nitrospira sp.]|nr:hypothetical protein [Nitrospira sp.]
MEAAPINFVLDFSGTVSYAGGATPLVTTNGGVVTVDNGPTTLPITGGLLDFSTGNFTGGSATSTGFQNIYGGGGSLTITGTVGSASGTLLSGSFSGPVTFDCCLAGTSSLNGLLTISSVDSTLASLLGFNLPATGGSLAQVQLFLSGLPSGPGVAFSGLQGGGVLTVTDYVPLPPAVFLMGSGLASLVG